MSSLLDRFGGASDDQRPEALTAVRLGQKPTKVVLFTDQVEDVLLHYVNDPEVRGYLVCPGGECPLCRIGETPEHFSLLPAYNLAYRTIEALHISDNDAPTSLAIGLLPHLGPEHLRREFLAISRREFGQYLVEAAPLQGDVSLVEAAIERFEASRAKGLELASAYRHMSAEELARVPSIREQLRAILPPEDQP